ncbi:metalloregulator ArsR/SmtB family transcription factor [Neorhizobium galegae]|uniref:ArsR/SmtB family transcription factor n=1 Tax=Neorhizobium galegae TaxID=399 RepID=UPI002106F024|nr:metalloregulator ArsR/SmtB family transcription factor [Neorhizobium galegae]MCQ1779110.1 metalloregulator ArsR/SmtB family transcription factor [Neorhizobium galegae]MCQ1799215.1 metalloregulator ArsR/SmtB family transcription factor [Neorhizobium galegae]
MRDFTFHPKNASALLNLLAHPARLRVLELVSETEWDVNSLATAVGLKQSALSQHLKKLRDAELVETRRDRQTVLYFCRQEAVGKILKTLRALAHLQGEKRFRRD